MTPFITEVNRSVPDSQRKRIERKLPSYLNVGVEWCLGPGNHYSKFSCELIGRTLVYPASLCSWNA